MYQRLSQLFQPSRPFFLWPTLNSILTSAVFLLSSFVTSHSKLYWPIHQIHFLSLLQLHNWLRYRLFECIHYHSPMFPAYVISYGIETSKVSFTLLVIPHSITLCSAFTWMLLHSSTMKTTSLWLSLLKCILSVLILQWSPHLLPLHHILSKCQAKIFYKLCSFTFKFVLSSHIYSTDLVQSARNANCELKRAGLTSNKFSSKIQVCIVKTYNMSISNAKSSEQPSFHVW